MQFCSLHHWVLFFIILTFTTGPSLVSDSVMVKHNQPALLPCESNRSSTLRWSMIDQPDFIVAQCNHTSCWSKEGFNISHDQYLKGNLSLTITAADYSTRGLYTCESNGKDILNIIRLSIEPKTSYEYIKSGDDLWLDLLMPGHMEVTYKSKDSPDLYGEPICSVTQHSLQCTDKYKARVSLRDPDLILKNVNTSDSGVYTVWDKKSNDIIVSYIVSVKKPPGASVKLHGSVTLDCMKNCSGLAEWICNEKDVVAWCNQTSCGSEEGYEMSRDRYLKGNLSLTITADDYSVRGWYECKCNQKIINEYRVIIEIINSSVQLKPGEDLPMELPLSEQVEVMYNGSVIYSNDPPNEQQFKVPYTRRLSNILKLDKVELSDSGVYTIRDTKNKEVLLIYNVTVKDSASASLSRSSQVAVGFGVSVPVVLLVLIGICLYKKYLITQPQRELVINDDT